MPKKNKLSKKRAMERAIKLHGGQILYGEFVLRNNVRCPLYVDWKNCIVVGPREEEDGKDG